MATLVTQLKRWLNAHVLDGECFFLFSWEYARFVHLVSLQLFVVKAAQHVEHAQHVVGCTAMTQVNMGRGFVFAVASASRCGATAATVECYYIVSIIAVLMSEFLIFYWSEIGTHCAFQCVTHSINLIGPRTCLASESRAVTVAALGYWKRCIASMLPHHAPVKHNLVIKALISQCECARCRW